MTTSRRPARDDGASTVGIVAIVAVVVLILAGAVILVMLVVSSLSSPAAIPTAAPAATTCTGATWFDPKTASCVPRAVCRGAEVYDERTNTCAVPGPELTGIAPNSGLSTGGTEIRLTGTDFQDPVTVLIDGVPATDVTVVSSTTVTAKTPGSKNLYPVDVQVANAQGPPAVLDNAFTYVTPPVERLTSITPDRGSRLGGEAVIIHGVGLTADTKVAFGGRGAKSVQLLNPTTLRVITPIGDGGAVAVNVDVPGEDPFTAPDAFTYVKAVPRIVMAIRPKEGGTAGGTKVTIVGTGFSPKAQVAIGGKPARKVKVVSSTKITAVTPKGALGPANVAVRNPGLPAAILEGGFEYVEAAEFTGIKPAKGSVDGGTKVTITGKGFGKDLTVTFDGVAAEKVKVVSATKATMTTPPGKAGPVDIVIGNPDQPTDTAKKAFTYVKAANEPGGGPAALPACRPIRVPAVAAAPGAEVTFGRSELFAGVSIDGPRLLSARVSGTPPIGRVAWQPAPVQIIWLAPPVSGATGTISYGYEADSCTGTSTASMPVSTR